MNTFRTLVAALSVVLCTAGVVNANLITVDETGPGVSMTIQISGPNIGTVRTPAGVIQLVVDGVAMDGFCIDPFNPGTPSSPGYQYIDLVDGPKGSPMGAETALLISRLWGSFYSADMSAENAAGLQIAIWRLTGGSEFNLLSACDFGAARFLETVLNPNYSGPVAELIGLTGPGQDYVVAKVPDGGSTVTLLGLAFCVLFVVGRQKRA